MAPEEARNVRNKLITITLAVIFVIEILIQFMAVRGYLDLAKKAAVT